MKVKERQEKYRQYLKTHPQFKTAKQAFLGMKRDGVIAKTTYFLDCKFVLKWFGEAPR